jgi:hypothetical protein
MKLLNTIFYFIFFIIFFYLAGKYQKLEREEKGNESKTQVLKYILSSLSFITSFTLFWILTRVFPLKLVLIILFANILILIITLIIGAVTGFSLPENQEKISTLSLLWTVQKTKMSCLIMLGLFLIGLFSFFAPLWIYWVHPIGDPKTLVIIALLLFTLPHLCSVAFSILRNWSLITSPYIDDDIRNSTLTSGFLSIITSTFYLLFPIWLFDGHLAEVQNIIGFSLPDFWILISIPILFFIFGSVIPFFIGIYRYHSQTKLMVEWRREWLEEIIVFLKLPPGNNRTELWKNKVEDLEAEIKKKSESNELLKFFIHISSGNLFEAKTNKFYLKFETPHNEVITDLVISEPLQEVSRTKENINKAREFIRGRIPFAKPQDQSQKLLFTKIESSKKQLIVWDLRFSYTYQLLILFGVVVEGDKDELKDYLSAELERAKNFLPRIISRKNWLAGTIISALSTGIIYLFNHYQQNIIEWINQVVNLK